MLPNRREVARRYANCVGYSLGFDPAEIEDRVSLRSRLGYGPEPLILVTIGGTAAGAPLLRRAAEAYPLMRKRTPGLKMVVVNGPRVPLDYVPGGDGLTVKGLVPNLFEHLAAADLVITAGGGTTTLELQALNKPFIYFPLEDHFEQQVDVCYHLERDGVGRKMSYSKTDANQLSQAALEEMEKVVNYPKLRLDGAKLAAQHLGSVIAKVERGELRAGS
jgi:predicted glycosyltransferase